MGILKKLFIFTLFLFPLGETIRINIGNGFIIKPLDVGIGVFILSWLALKVAKKQKIKQASILLSAILFALCGLLSLIINNLNLSQKEFFISLSYLLRWIVYAGVFFAVSDFNKSFKKKISEMLIIIGSLIVVLGYLQYFFYSNLKNLFYLGWDEHMYRMFSIFLDPNFAGAFFVLFFLFLANKFIKKRNNLLGLLILLTLGSVFLTFSRSALIMLITSSSLLFLMLNKKVFVGALLGIILLVLAISARYFNIENINLFRLVSSEARIKTAEKAIEIVENNLIFGVGFNAYRYAKLDNDSRGNSLTLASHADAGTDNSFLFVMATTGVIGFALYLFLWLNILRHNARNNPLILSSIVGVFVSSLFINSLFYIYIMFWLWVVIGSTESS